MLNKWNYDPLGEVCYGEEIVYQKAAQFLGDTVEDWGCGTGWLGHYIKNYKGIDGSPSGLVKNLIDLRNYTSRVDNIALRQVLEHNIDWEIILENAIKSFKKKLFISIHTPFTDYTQVIHYEENGIPTISFNKHEILDCLKGLKVIQDKIKTTFEYGEETIFYVEKV